MDFFSQLQVVQLLTQSNFWMLSSPLKETLCPLTGLRSGPQPPPSCFLLIEKVCGLWAFHTNGIIQCLPSFLASCTQHNVFKVHPNYYNVSEAHFFYISQWLFRLILISPRPHQHLPMSSVFWVQLSLWVWCLSLLLSCISLMVLNIFPCT